MQNSELLEGEELRPVEGAGKKYLVSNMGRVYSARKGGFLKLQNVNGYAFVGLCKGGRSRLVSVSRLVARTYLPLPAINTSQLNVRHINGDNLDNRAENLKWVEDRKRKEVGEKAEVEKKELKSFYRPVAQYSLEGEYIASYRSASFAGQKMTSGKGGNGVYECARGSAPTAYGYRWAFITPEEYEKRIKPENLEPLPKKKKKRKSKKEREKWRMKRIPTRIGETFVPFPVKSLRDFMAISNLGRIYNTRYGKFIPVQDNGHIWLYGSCYNVSKLTELTHNEQ